jgi:hypothetical protein
MSKHEKLKDRFLSKPKDFTWPELVKFLGVFGYVLKNAGKSSGSRVRFITQSIHRLLYINHTLNPF